VGSAAASETKPCVLSLRGLVQALRQLQPQSSELFKYLPAKLFDLPALRLLFLVPLRMWWVAPASFLIALAVVWHLRVSAMLTHVERVIGEIIGFRRALTSCGRE
jgi:hypothetical protein